MPTDPLAGKRVDMETIAKNYPYLLDQANLGLKDNTITPENYKQVEALNNSPYFNAEREAMGQKLVKSGVQGQGALGAGLGPTQQEALNKLGLTQKGGTQPFGGALQASTASGAPGSFESIYGNIGPLKENTKYVDMYNNLIKDATNLNKGMSIGLGELDQKWLNQNKTVSDNNETYTKMDDNLTKTKLAVSDYNEILTKSDGVNTLYSQGQQDQLLKWKELQAANISNSGTLAEWNKEQANSVYQQDQVTAGVQSQQQKYLELKDSILNNTGVIKTYNSQLQDQQFISDNVVSGMQAQQIAFNDQTAAIYQNQGALIAYGQELDSGRLQSNAFTEGQQAQTQAFYDTIIASEQAQGSYETLNQQLGQGLIQNAAFNKGLAEGRLEIANQTLALDESKGALAAYQEGIQSGVVTAKRI